MCSETHMPCVGLFAVLCAIPVLSEEGRVIGFLHFAIAHPAYMMLGHVRFILMQQKATIFRKQSITLQTCSSQKFLTQALTLTSLLKMITCYFRCVTWVIVYIRRILG